MAHKAPGKHYREGITLPQLLRKFHDTQNTITSMMKLRLECPSDGGTIN